MNLQIKGKREMLRQKERQIIAILYLGVAVGMLLLIPFCAFFSTDRIHPYDFFHIPWGILFLVLLLTIIAKGISKLVAEKFDWLFYISLAIYAVFLFVTCIRTQGSPVGDSYMLVETAKQLALGKPVAFWHYFSRCKNNLFPMLYLAVVYKFGFALKLPNPYYLVYAGNTLQVVAAMVAMKYILSKIRKESTSLTLLACLFMGGFLPVFAHTQSQYTDAFSFCFGICGTAIWLWNQENIGKKYVVWNMIAGLVWGIGAEFKITAAIPMIAVLFFVFLNRRKILLSVITILIPVLCVFLACKIGCKDFVPKEYKDVYELPVTEYFVGLGLERDGSYIMESEFINQLSSIYGYDEKKAFARDFIWKNKSQFVNPRHLGLKAAKNFSSGTMMASDFLNQPKGETFVYRMIMGNEKYWYAQKVTRYWFLMYFLNAIGCLWGIRLLIKNKEYKMAQGIIYLSIVGIMLYMMIGESNNRQLYNHLSWFMCGASIGAIALWDWTLQVGKRFSRLFT